MHHPAVERKEGRCVVFLFISVSSSRLNLMVNALSRSWRLLEEKKHQCIVVPCNYLGTRYNRFSSSTTPDSAFMSSFPPQVISSIAIQKDTEHSYEREFLCLEFQGCRFLLKFMCGCRVCLKQPTTSPLNLKVIPKRHS